MKVIKICIVASVLSVFATSCRNKDCNANMASETAAPATATSVNDGTQAAMPVPADTPGITTADMNDAERESGSGSTRHRAQGRNKPVKEQTSASSGSGNGSTPAEVDLEASKRREGNFTHGTGAENPGR